MHQTVKMVNEVILVPRVFQVNKVSAVRKDPVVMMERLPQMVTKVSKASMVQKVSPVLLVLPGRLVPLARKVSWVSMAQPDETVLTVLMAKTVTMDKMGPRVFKEHQASMGSMEKKGGKVEVVKRVNREILVDRVTWESLAFQGILVSTVMWERKVTVVLMLTPAPREHGVRLEV